LINLQFYDTVSTAKTTYRRVVDVRLFSDAVSTADPIQHQLKLNDNHEWWIGINLEENNSAFFKVPFQLIIWWSSFNCKV